MPNAIGKRKIIEERDFISGKNVERLEKKVAVLYKKKHAVGVGSGTDALLLGLDALGVGKDDEVITTPFSFISPAEAVARLGGRPVFTDVNYNDFLINVNEIEKNITEKTKVILPVHLFGQVCDMEGIMRIAEEYGVYVAEDGAQAFGKKGLGKGDLLCFSFHPSKCLGGWGQGGMVLTNDKKLADTVRSLRNHGADLSKGSIGKYHNIRLGYNSRISETQAAVLLERIRAFKKQPVKRLWTFRTKNRDLVKGYLDRKAIDNKIYYDRLLHLQPVFKYLGYKKGDFPVAEKAGKEILTVNLYQTYKEYIK